MFWHIRNEYAAPEFFMAAAAVWGCSIVARMVYRNRFVFPLSNVTRGFPTTLEELPGNMTRVAVTVPPKMRWMPGQHCYITVPGISSLGNHPFTIASIPRPRYDGEGQSHEMVFLIRECGGFTKLLGKHARSVSALSLAISESRPKTPSLSIHDEALNSTRSPSAGRGKRTSEPQNAATLRAPSPSSPSWRLNADEEDSRPWSPATLAVPDTTAGRGRQSSASSSYISLDKLEAQQIYAHVTAWIDGPFGDYQRPLHRHYEGFITVAGGSGVTASLPWITYLTNKMRRAAESRYNGEEYECKMRNVTFIWSIRKAEWIAWARRELIHALRTAAASEGCFRAVVYVTSRDIGREVVKNMQLDLMLAAGLAEGIERSSVEIRLGRPSMEKVVPDFLDRKRNMVRGECV
jgi:NAD(P)H-flavin reductase